MTNQTLIPRKTSTEELKGGSMRTYQIHDRGSDYIVELNGDPLEAEKSPGFGAYQIDYLGRTFTMRVSNLSILRRAVRYWRRLGFVRQRTR